VQVEWSVGVAEGRGARVRRLFPTRSLDYFDLFVLFDELYEPIRVRGSQVG